MWHLQQSLWEKVNDILINKFKNLSLRLVLLQIIKALVFLRLAMISLNFPMTNDVIFRFFLVNISILLINLFFLGLFMIIEMKMKRVYSLSFISIVGGLTVIITMLTSKFLSFLNPFAWMASLLNISYVKEGDK